MNDFETTKQVSPLTNSELDRKELIALAEKSGFVLNPVGQLVVPAPHDDATPYLRRFLKLALSTEAQQEVTGAVARIGFEGGKITNLDTAVGIVDGKLYYLYEQPTPSAIEGYAQELAKRLVREKLEEVVKVIKSNEFSDGMLDMYASDLIDEVRALMESPQPSVEEPAN